MAMLITTVADAKKRLAPEHFATFCEENMIPPNADLDDEVVAIDKHDLMRFGATEDAEQLIADVAEITGRTTAPPAGHF